jgi:hypothetical protein
MVVYPGKQFDFLAAVTFDDGIIKNQDFYAFRSCELIKYGSDLSCQEKQKAIPVVGCFIQETVIRVLGNSLVFMFRIQETKQVLSLKY